MADRLATTSALLIAGMTACSVLAPSDSEFFKAPGAAGTGVAGADAAGTGGTAGTVGGAGAGGTSASGGNGEGGSSAGSSGRAGTGAAGGAGGEPAGGAAGSGATDDGGGTGSGQAGTLGSAGIAGSGGASGSVGQAGASGGSSGSTTDSGADGSGCTPQNTVQSCGPRCERCTAPDDRTTPTCNGISCGITCRSPTLKCSDNSCSQLVWNFDSGSLAGVSSASPLAVRTFDGSRALALDIAQLNAVNGVSFTLSICASGNVDLRTKTLSFRVYFQGVPQSTFELIMQAWLPTRPDTAGFLGGVAPATGTWTTFSAPLSESAFSGTTTTVMIEAATTGVGFSGTIWFDDVRIQ